MTHDYKKNDNTQRNYAKNSKKVKQIVRFFTFWNRPSEINTDL